MAWAFLAAGSRAVLASQWRVESTSTTELMARFHAAWRGGSGKAEALRNAALELLRSDRFRHPFYWAGFQLFGDGTERLTVPAKQSAGAPDLNRD